MENTNKIAHLEFIQNTIIRMSSNSFTLKGWCVTIIAALVALSIKESSFWLYLFTIVPTTAFWLLDSYYLLQEKLFRHLYDDVRTKNEDEINFSFDISSYKSKESYAKIVFDNVSTSGFYLPLIGLLLLICVIA